MEVLKNEGFIRAYETQEVRKGISEIVIELKYHEGQGVIHEIKRRSKPGRRVYSKIKSLNRVYNGLGMSILTTPRGVMSDVQARNENVGGEVLAEYSKGDKKRCQESD